MNWKSTSLPLFFSTLFLLLISRPAAGQPAVFTIDSLQDEWPLNDYLFVLELEDGSLSPDQLRNPEWASKFLPYRDFIQKYQHEATSGKVLLDPSKVYWWRLSIQNNLDQPVRDWVLHTGRSNFTEVYKVGEDGKVASVHYTGWLMPIGKKDYQTGNRQAERVSFSLQEGGSATLYGKVSVANQKEPYIQVHLAKEDFYKNRDFIEKTSLDWAFTGFLLTFIFLNFLLFASTYDRVFLWHALFQTGIFLYLLEFFNVLPDMPWMRERPHTLQVFTYAALCLMDVAYLQFIRFYMRMKTAWPFWDRCFRWFAISRLAFAAGIITFYLSTINVKLADDLTALFLVGQYSVMIVLLAWIFGKKDHKSLFLIAGTAVFVVGVVLNALSVLEGTGLRFSYTQFGVMGEVFLFTLGLGLRMKILQKEENEALRLKDLDEFKSKFYTNITHEFRTPLTVIMGNSEIGKLEIENPDKPVSQFPDSLIPVFDAITRNAGQLLRLVNRLLDLSKLQSGKMTLQMRLGDIADYLRYLVQSFHSFAAGKDIHLRYLSEMDDYYMDFDAEKIQDMVSNLISNAVKFSPPGSEIVVKVKSLPDYGLSGERLQLSVEDNGSGIPPEALPYIFDRFFTAKDTGNPAGGSGIGLALTKELAELMGGSIVVESEPGKGTEFTITLPVSRNAPPVEQAAVKSLPSETSAVAPVPSLKSLPSDDEEKPLCLVIDDNADVVRYLQTLLESEYAVAIAYDGLRGIEKALDLLPDVIISDVMMPEKDGLEVCDFLKNDERTSHIPVILLTAKATVQDRIEGLRRGADAYLQKPFNREELFICLKKSVELRNRLINYFSKLPSVLRTETAVPELVIEDAFILKARNAVEENLADDEFDIHHLCRALALSRAQLHRKLTALTGKSATHFIRSIRLARAKELLSNTDLTIAEIAYEAGFRDPNYFSRTFTEEFGVPPSEERRQG